MLFIFYLTIDLYFSLFIENDPNNSALLSAILLLSPYIISILFIDIRFLQLLITTTSAIVVQ